MVDATPVQWRTTRVSSSWLGVMATMPTAIMGRWTGKSSHKLTSSPLYPRYDSEGKYLGSLPDLATARNRHSCTSFLTDNGDQVSIPCAFQLSFLCISNRSCWLLEVATLALYRAPRSSSLQVKVGREERIFPGFQIIWINHRYHCTNQIVTAIIKILAIFVIIVETIISL